MLSIIITHYRTPNVLKLSLEYFQRACAQLEPGENSEIIVADSGTESSTRDMMAGFCSSLVIGEEHLERSEVTRGELNRTKSKGNSILYLPEEKNVGYAKAVNRGISIARGNFIFVANADLIASDATIFKTLLAYMRENPDVGIVAPRLLNFNGTVQHSAFRYYTLATIIARRTFLGKTSWGKKLLKDFALEDIMAHIAKPIPVDWLMGSALLIRKSALDKVGLLDETFFMYMEDVDWCRRFWDNGYKVIYNPEASAHHYHFQASKKTGGLLDLLLNPYTRMHARSAFVYFKKYGLSAPNHRPPVDEADARLVREIASNETR
ncbi:MAG: glycosyltransferase family 2 protein [Candidatus Spechtbacteria bacterium]|nr:glycosyltransferase family 2 protein [Candidatus Spechtbacteria bacterium]